MTEPFARETLSVPPEAFLRVLPSMGRLMVTARHNGATHERIGTVEQVAVENGTAVLSGAEHDSRFVLSAVGALVVDRTGRMGEMELPRVDILDRAGKPIAAVVGFDGLDPFNAALALLPVGTEAEPKVPPAPPERSEVTEDDPGRVPFTAALASGQAVAIELRRPDFTQRWQGVVEGVKPAMGFINVMRPDFHLHLKAGAVAGWRQEETAAGEAEWAALGADGAELGLFVLGPLAAFASR